MFMKSTDKGRNWTKKTLETGNNAGYYSSLALSGSSIYVSYTVEIGSIDNLKFIKSADGGSTWSPAVTVDSVGDVGEYNSIAVYNNTVIISYSDQSNDDLKAAISTDGGSTWPTLTPVDSSSYVGMFTSITVDGSGNFFISYWFGAGNLTHTIKPVLRVARYNGSWSTATIADTSDCYGLNTVIRASGNTVYIAYFDAFSYTSDTDHWDFISDAFSIKVVKSEDSGGTWSMPVSVTYLTNLTSYAYMNNRIDLVFSGANVYVSYADVIMKAMYVAKSTDSGVSFTPLVLDPKLNSTYCYNYTSQLAIVGTELYSVYVDGLYSIVFALSSDSGATWNWY
jgi:hypothetical protein